MDSNYTKGLKPIPSVKLPVGTFCAGSHNCSDCSHYSARDKDQHGRGYCYYYATHYYPSDRQGCANYNYEG